MTGHLMQSNGFNLLYYVINAIISYLIYIIINAIYNNKNYTCDFYGAGQIQTGFIR